MSAEVSPLPQTTPLHCRVLDRDTYDTCLDRRDYRAEDVPEGVTEP